MVLVNNHFSVFLFSIKMVDAIKYQKMGNCDVSSQHNTEIILYEGVIFCRCGWYTREGSYMHSRPSTRLLEFLSTTFSELAH